MEHTDSPYDSRKTKGYKRYNTRGGNLKNRPKYHYELYVRELSRPRGSEHHQRPQHVMSSKTTRVKPNSIVNTTYKG